jgi:hypothetical protein
MKLKSLILSGVLALACVSWTGCAGLSVKAVAPGATLSVPAGAYYIQGVIVGPTTAVTNIPGPAVVATGVQL